MKKQESINQYISAVLLYLLHNPKRKDRLLFKFFNENTLPFLDEWLKGKGAELSNIVYIKGSKQSLSIESILSLTRKKGNTKKIFSNYTIEITDTKKLKSFLSNYLASFKRGIEENCIHYRDLEIDTLNGKVHYRENIVYFNKTSLQFLLLKSLIENRGLPISFAEIGKLVKKHKEKYKFNVYPDKCIRNLVVQIKKKLKINRKATICINILGKSVRLSPKTHRK